MWSSSMKRNLLLSLVVTLLAVTCTWAQTGTTSLRGTVIDKSGAAIVGAKVTLTSAAQAFKREMQTGQTGEYEFVALPPSTYVFTVEMTNFRRFENKNVQLLVNTPATINVTLEVGAATEAVEVSEEPPKKVFETTGKIKLTSQDHRFLRALKISVDDDPRRASAEDLLVGSPGAVDSSGPAKLSGPLQAA